MLGRDKGQLDTGNHLQPMGLGQDATGFDDTGNDEVNVGVIPVIGDGDRPIARHRGIPDQLRGDKLSIAEDGVGVKIDQSGAPVPGMLTYRIISIRHGCLSDLYRAVNRDLHRLVKLRRQRIARGGAAC